MSLRPGVQAGLETLEKVLAEDGCKVTELELERTGATDFCHDPMGGGPCASPYRTSCEWGEGASVHPSDRHVA